MTDIFEYPAVLARFCANVGDLREQLMTPFRTKYGITRTNGHILIATPEELLTTDAVVDARFIESVETYLDGVASGSYAPFTMPDDPPHCPRCQGKGVLDKLEMCKKCNGGGDVVCDLGHYHNCEGCLGSGESGRKLGEVECWQCEGTMIETTGCEINGVLLAWLYLFLINKLPGVELQTDASKDAKVIGFRFRDGFGAIAQMRWS